MSDVKTIKCKLTSSDGGQLLFGRLKDELAEEFIKCHNSHAPFVGVSAPDIRDWSDDTAEQVFLSFKGIKKSAEEGDFSSVLVVEEDNGNTVEVDLSLVPVVVEEELQSVTEDGFYFLSARWGSCSVPAWNASIEGSFDPKKLQVKVKKAADSFLNFRTVDEKILLCSSNYITSVVYDTDNKSDAVDHEIYDIVHNVLNFERVSRVLCIMQVRNNEKSIVYYFDESRDAEKYLPLIEKASLVNKDDNPWDPATRHKVCDFVSLENPHDTNSDWQEHDYPQTPVDDVKIPEPQLSEPQQTEPQTLAEPVADKVTAEEPVVQQDTTQEEKKSYLEEFTQERLSESSDSDGATKEDGEQKSDSFIDYLAAAQQDDHTAGDKSEDTANDKSEELNSQYVADTSSSMLDYLNDDNDSQSSVGGYSAPADGAQFGQSVEDTELPSEEQNLAIAKMLKQEPAPDSHDEKPLEEADKSPEFPQTVSSGPFTFMGGAENSGTTHTIVMEGSKCPVCGRTLADGDKFCGYCGNNLSESKQFCTNCGTRLRPWANFCSQCGYPVKK
ncbi:MAG: zinc ribbon domain-containing protein [Succinivibrio sp.]|nr:zinc ribbon domain-containing protein [Succinivibrio sp.]